MVSTFALVASHVLIINVWAKSLGQYTGNIDIISRFTIWKLNHYNGYLYFSI